MTDQCNRCISAGGGNCATCKPEKDSGKQTTNWGNHCLCEWCCPNKLENMFCICARNLDDTIESCEHDTRPYNLSPRPAPYLPLNLNFQPVCIDKPCIGQINICPVDDECDSVKQCVEHADWLKKNPDVAEQNQKIVSHYDEAIKAEERERVLDLIKLWAKPKRDGWCDNDCNRDPFEEVLHKIESLRKGEP